MRRAVPAASRVERPPDPMHDPTARSVADPLARAGRIAFVVGALAVLSVALRRVEMLPDKPLAEDGFYLLTVARHLALGEGLTIDGVHLTNGIQPLFTFLAVPAYWLAGGDRVEALRWVLLLDGLFFVSGAWWFGLVLRDLRLGRGDREVQRLRWVGSLAWLASGHLFLMSHTGLETGCALFFYLAYWRLSQRWPLCGIRAAVAHGGLLGVLVLARIDATFFVAAITGLHVLRGGRPLAARLREAAVAGLAAVAVSSPWWIFNVVQFGSLMPISGMAESGGDESWGGIVVGRGLAALDALLLDATPMLWSGGAGDVVFHGLHVLLLFGVAGVLWRTRSPRREGAVDPHAGRSVALALLVAGVGLAAYYSVRFWATHFYGRYFVLLAPLGLAAFAVAAVRLADRLPRLGRVLPLGLLACTGGLVFVAHTGRMFVGNAWLHDQVAVVREHVPPGAPLAAGQTGTLGYFVDGVHNLDGKVNAEALRCQGHMERYLDEHGIEWLCDWPAYLERYVGAAHLAQRWQLVARRGEFELWRRRHG